MKTILITGSNSDIGIAVAKALGEHPVNLALQYHSNQAKADALKNWLDEKTISNTLFKADLTSTCIGRDVDSGHVEGIRKP